LQADVGGCDQLLNAINDLFEKAKKSSSLET
jgi:hypothetical protein